MVVKIVIVFVECHRMTHTPLVSQCNSQRHWSVTSVWLDGHVCTIFCIREQRQMVTKHWKLLIVTFQKWMSLPKSAFTHSLWFPLTAYRSGVPPFLKNRNVFFVFVFKVELWNQISELNITMKVIAMFHIVTPKTIKLLDSWVPSHKCWCQLHVWEATSRCARSLQSWPGSGRSPTPVLLFWDLHP